MADFGLPAQTWQQLLPQAQTPEQQANAMLIYQKAQQAQQDRSGGNAIAQLFANPANLQNGFPKPEAVAQGIGSGAVPPKAGMEMIGAATEFQQKLAQQQRVDKTAAMKMQDENRKWLVETVSEPASVKYQEVLQKTGSTDEAQKAAQEVYSSGLDQAKSSGRLTPQEQQGLLPNYDHSRVMANVLGLKEIVSGRRADQAATLAGSRDARADRKADEPKFVGDIVAADGKKLAGQPLISGGPTGWQDAKGNPVEANNIRHMGTAGTPDPDDPAVAKTAQAIAGYQQAPLSGYALRAPGAQAVMAKVLELNPDYQATRYPEVAKAMRDFGTGTQGNTTRSLNVAIDHLDSLSGLATALNNTDVSMVNRVSNLVKTELGLSTAPNTFEAAKSIVGAEVVKAVVGGVTALGDREEARKPIDAARSPQQLADVIGEYKRLMAGQLKGLERQYQDATGFGPDSQFSYRKKLDPRTVKELGDSRTPNTSEGATAPSTKLPGGGAEAAIPPAPGGAAPVPAPAATAAPPIELVPKAQRQDGKVVVLKDENGSEHRFIVTGGGTGLIPAVSR